MVKVGDDLYGMRIVKDYDGQLNEERPLFSGFEGVVVWNTWDTSEWQILLTWCEDGEHCSEEMGLIDYHKIDDAKSGEEIANIIKEEIKAKSIKHPKLRDKPIAIDETMARTIQYRNE